MKFGTMAILGCPNVGKSTLVNTLVKQKVAIVSDRPQTTRTRILGVAHCPQGQLALLDTPGLHEPWHRLNKRMVQTAWDALDEADILAIMVDGRQLPGDGDRFVLGQVATVQQSRPNLPVFLLVNKIDLINKQKLLPIIDAYRSLCQWTEVVPISAMTGLNVDRLTALLFEQVPDGEEAYDEEFVTNQSMRQLAAEIVREKVIQHTKAELPYAIAVRLDQFIEEGRLAKIGATILVEKSGQKGIVIGKGGARLKDIGTAARLEMETEFGMKVYLELLVKVKEGWRDDDQMLIELGY